MHSSERHSPAETTAATPHMTSPRPQLSPPLLGQSIRLLSLVLVVVAIVHRPAAAGTNAADASTHGKAVSAPADPAPVASAPAPEPLANLPRPAREMIDAILAAVHTGSIEELRTAIEWNELKPIFAPSTEAASDDDPIEFLKKASKDGKGAETLSIIDKLLSVAPARQPLGRDFENNTVYVWPYLAERPLASLSPTEEADLQRIVPPDEIAAIRAAGRWNWYRLTVGADGTWHSFMKHE